jgi:O-acetyl-ADP-ribose deacetylase (regulator of RNase III)
MSGVHYRKGDATAPEGEGAKVICHICNDVGGCGKGFVVAISRRWKQPEMEYRAWHAGREDNDFALGAVPFVQVAPDLWVANMVGQRGLGPGRDGPPIRYEAVAQCLQQVAEKAVALGASAHMPRIGCGLAGGDWSRIEPLLEEHLCGRGVAVTVYDLA